MDSKDLKIRGCLYRRRGYTWSENHSTHLNTNYTNSKNRARCLLVFAPLSWLDAPLLGGTERLIRRDVAPEALVKICALDRRVAVRSSLRPVE